MFLYGASGHCKVVIDAIELASTKTIDGVFDDNPKGEFIAGIPIIDTKVAEVPIAADFVITIGNNVLRKKIANKLDANFKSVFHTKSIIAKSVSVGDGTVVLAGAIVNSDVKIGKHCIINSNVVLEHDCEIANYVHVSPSASLAGNVVVGEGTHIGIGSSVIQGIQIGKWVTVGAGSVIIKDIPDYAVVVGNPGKIIKYNNTDLGL
jgi:acetyltransferase EpsM